MNIEFNDERPLFVQIAEQLEDGILSGAFPEESQLPSTTEISVTYKLNPATALKGINLLVESGVVYKKRGLGMFVTKGAVTVLRKKRKEEFFENFIVRLTKEATRLELSKDEIIDMIERGYNK